MSYSYYLVHGLALKALAFIAERVSIAAISRANLYWIVLPAAFVCTIVAGIALFGFVERPLSIGPAPAEREQSRL
jgi:peptidoglycan/LPS O-acetylase OafA/YrhL